MSLAALGALSRGCARAPLAPLLAGAASPARAFSSTPAASFRRQPKGRKEISKKARDAKDRRREAARPKSVYEREKMPLSEAIAVLRAVEVTRPKATFEILIRTGMPRGTAVPKGRINMPRSAGSKNKEIVLAFAEGRLADDAKRAGVDIVGGQELVEGVVSGKIQATTFLCAPDLIRTITPRLGRILGPRGLMPSDRRGTVTEDFAGYMRRLNSSEEWKGDKRGTIRMPIAKMDWPTSDVEQNVNHLLQAVMRVTGNTAEAQAEAKRTGNSKPVNPITKVILSSTYGPGIRLAV